MGATNRYLGIDGLDSSTWKEVITFDRTEQRVGIGTDAPTELLEVHSTGASTAIEVSAGQASTTTGEAKIVLRSLHSSSGTTYSRSEIASLGVAGGDSDLIFRTTTDSNGPQERMRITDDGVLCIGDSSPESDAFASTKCLFLQGAESVQTIKNTSASDSAQRVAIGFLNSSGTGVGYISNNSTSTVFGESSDYRLKENVIYDWEALPRLAQLKPARFNFKVDPDSTVDGFLAHEAQTVVPEAVQGTYNETKDLTNVVLNEFGNVIAKEVTEDDWKAGKEAEEGEQPQYAANTTWKAEHTQDVYQGIDKSKLVPLMVKAIQELEAKVKALEEA